MTVDAYINWPEAQYTRVDKSQSNGQGALIWCIISLLHVCIRMNSSCRYHSISEEESYSSSRTSQQVVDNSGSSLNMVQI